MFLILLAFDLMFPKKFMEKVVKSLNLEDLGAKATRELRSIRRHSLANVILCFSTMMSGAFVSGNDAGRVFNSFPKMGGYLLYIILLYYSYLFIICVYLFLYISLSFIFIFLSFSLYISFSFSLYLL